MTVALINSTIAISLTVDSQNPSTDITTGENSIHMKVTPPDKLTYTFSPGDAGYTVVSPIGQTDGIASTDILFNQLGTWKITFLRGALLDTAPVIMANYVKVIAHEGQVPEIDVPDIVGSNFSSPP